MSAISLETTVQEIQSLSAPRTRNHNYFIDEQMTIFLVENSLFKVHRHFLRRESVVLDSMFDCPSPPNGQDGQTEENPIVLPGVTALEFEALLDYIYDGGFSGHRRWPGIPSLQKSIDLLSIATRLECVHARAYAIQNIQSSGVNAATKIDLAEKHDVRYWLLPAYVELCKRVAPLSLSEGELLGIQKVVLLAQAREEIRSAGYKPSLVLHMPLPPPSPSPLPPPSPYMPYAPDPYSSMIRAIFGLESEPGRPASPYD